MTTAPAADKKQAPETFTGLTAYAAAVEQSDTPILGHLVLHSVASKTRVTRDDLSRWFAELGLDETFLPPPIRQVDAYAQAAGSGGARETYRLSTTPTPGPDDKTVTVTLMVRHVSRDNTRIVRHLVREVRDEEAATLSYDTRLAEIMFWRDPAETGRAGAGVLQIHPNEPAIAQLSETEQEKVRRTLADIEETYQERCRYYAGDRLRSLVRRCVEGLNAVRVHASGGMYFVHRAHGDQLAALRELVSRFGTGCHLTRVPLPAQDEMRELVVAAITTKTKEDLDRLAADIAEAGRSNASDTQVQGLLRRFKSLQQATAEHEQLLESTLDETRAALQLVNAQVSSLIAGSW